MRLAYLAFALSFVGCGSSAAEPTTTPDATVQAPNDDGGEEEAASDDAGFDSSIARGDGTSDASCPGLPVVDAGDAGDAGDADGVDAGTVDAGPPVSFANDVQPILNANCGGGGCHLHGNKQEGLDLSPDASFTSLVGVPAEECGDGGVFRVAPQDPARSYIVTKLHGANLCSGDRMPEDQNDPLDDSDQATILRWICAGAPNN